MDMHQPDKNYEPEDYDTVEGNGEIENVESMDHEEEEEEEVKLDEENIEEYIEALERHREEKVAEGNYIEAELAKNKIKELKEQNDRRKKEELKERHLNEKLEMEEHQLEEFNEFNEIWDQRMNEYETQAKRFEQEMIEQQQEEMNEFLKELDESVPNNPKDTTELLNMRQIEKTLAKQQDYLEAHKVQQICQRLEQEQFEKHQLERQFKIKKESAQLKLKQDKELTALRKKIVTGQEAQRKTRSLELERLLQKYQNLKKELENRQKMEMLSLNKAFKNPTNSASIYSTRYGSQYGSVYRTNSRLFKNRNKNQQQKPRKKKARRY